MTKARTERRLLLAWLYGQASPVGNALCRQVLSSEVFGAFLSEYFIFWPGDAERWLVPAQLKEFLRLPKLPVLLVLQPLNVFEAEVLPWGDPNSGAPVEFP